MEYQPKKLEPINTKYTFLSCTKYTCMLINFTIQKHYLATFSTQKGSNAKQEIAFYSLDTFFFFFT